MSNTNIRFCRATREDIPGMVRIEEEFFSDYEKAFDQKFFDQWFEHNADMFFVIKNVEEDVLGFVVLTPITEALHNRLIKGEVFDFFDFSKSEVIKTMDSDYYYISDICISRSRAGNYMKAFINIAGGMIGILAEKAKYVTACPVTTAGARLCRTVGMKKVAESESNGARYSVCLLKVTPEIIGRFQRIAERTNRTGDDNND